jgi:hypothetical protein
LDSLSQQRDCATPRLQGFPSAESEVAKVKSPKCHRCLKGQCACRNPVCDPLNISDSFLLQITSVVTAHLTTMSDNEENSHPPVFGKKRKTATRPRKPAKTNAVGSAKLEGLFAPSIQAGSAAPSVQVGSAAPSVESTEDPDTRYAIRDNLDSMELDSVSSQAQPLQSPTGTQSDKSMTDMPAAYGSQEQEIQEDQPRGARTSASASASISVDMDEKPHEYSNEARTYMARYDYVSNTLC